MTKVGSIIVLISLFFTTISSAQVFDWVTQLACGAIIDINDQTVDSNGNQYITGRYGDQLIYDTESGQETLSSGVGQDGFVVKLDPSGNVVMALTFDFDSYITGPSIAIDESGSLYLTGGYQNNMDADPGPEEYFLTTNGFRDIYIIKLDSEGNFVWAHTIGGGSSDFGVDISIDSEGNIIGIGKFSGNNPVDFNPADNVEANLSVDESGQTYILKLNSNGEFIWAKNFGGYSSSQGIQLDVDDNIYILGKFEGAFGNTDFDPGEGISVLSSVSGTDIFILKLDNDANFIWARALTGTYQENPESFDIDSSGNVYITGGFRMDIDLDPGPDQQLEESNGSWDIFIVKLTTNGDLAWGKAIGAGVADWDEGLSIAVNDDGDIYTIGRFEGEIDFQPGSEGMQLSSPEGEKVYVAKLDTYGNFIWLESYTGYSKNHHLSIDPYGGIYLAGEFLFDVDFDPDVAEAILFTDNTSDIYVVKWYDDSDNCASTVSGRMFLDLNENAVFDADDTPYAHGNYSVSWMPYQFLARSDGTYERCAPVGMHHITIESSPEYFEPIFDSMSFEMAEDQPVENLDFPIVASEEILDLEVFIWADEPNIPGFTREYYVQYSNIGSICAENVEISVNLDEFLNLLSVSPANYSIYGQEVILSVGTLCPFETGTIVLEVNLPVTVSLGEELLTTALITPMAGDINPLNNKDEYATTVVGSFDPNDKNVSHSIVHPEFLVNEKYLRYLIRFQNTGTYYAQNVVVEDPLSPHLDISSFRLLNASHPVDVEYNDGSLNFIFEDIMLPDSLSNEPESHGYINYLIRPEIDLPLGSVVENTAYIYFDFNEPIVTNTTQTHYTLPVVEAIDNDHQIQIYPNPARNSIHLSWGSLTAIGFEILDLSGRLVIEDRIIDEEGQTQISVKHLRAGMYTLRLFSLEGTSTARWVKN